MIMIKKAVIPAAGLGVRLLPATKEQPKEMLPFFAEGTNGQFCLKPLLQIVFERLYNIGFKEFCFIVGRSKRSIEDHFTIDSTFITQLKNRKKLGLAKELEQFYEKIRDSNLIFVNQPAPLGFGDAVYHAKLFTGEEKFLVHAGDDLILSKNNGHLTRLLNVFEKYNASAAFCVERVKNPQKYGVITGKQIEENVYKVEKISEKPSVPLSNIAVVAVYVFKDKIYEAIPKISPDENNEIQLTNAIQQLIDEKRDVYAVALNSNEKRIDIGTPESYWAALNEAMNLLT
jgi:UTP--glucose-1-phosphate uridylyltransferase